MARKLKCWKKTSSKPVYTNKKGDEIGILKWSNKEFHILSNPKKGDLKKIGETKNKSLALRKEKEDFDA